MLVFYLLIVTIASYAVDIYRASTTIAGLVSSIYLIGSLAGRLIAGHLIAKAGPAKILMIRVVFYFISACLYLIKIHIGFLLFTRFTQGIFMGTIGTSAGTIAASILPASRKGEGIGFYSLSAIFASACLWFKCYGCTGVLNSAKSKILCSLLLLSWNKYKEKEDTGYSI